MNDLDSILQDYSAITLREMEDVKLMDRTDTKYVFHREKLNLVLALVKEHYHCLSIEGKTSSAYKTLYYDTSDLELYHQHHNGRLNRYKIRHRTYVDSGLAFLEVKYKNNRGRTIKTRISAEDIPLEWNSANAAFLKEKTPFLPQELRPCLWVNYTRITLVSKHSKERLTIDLNLEFEKEGQLQQYNGLVIAEVKQERAGQSEFMRVMKTLRIQEGSISKYCMAVARTHDKVKKNNFKGKLLNIDKLLKHDITANC